MVWTGIGFKKMRHQYFFKRNQNKILTFPLLVQCFAPFMPLSNLVVFESPGPSVLSCRDSVLTVTIFGVLTVTGFGS